jgi:hypothetical protein
MEILQFPIQVFIFGLRSCDPALIGVIIHNLVCFICMKNNFGEKALQHKNKPLDLCVDQVF